MVHKLTVSLSLTKMPLPATTGWAQVSEVATLIRANSVYSVLPGLKAANSPLRVSASITAPAFSIAALWPRFVVSVQSVAPVWALAQ